MCITHKHIPIQSAGADEGALTPWLFASPTDRGYWPLIQEDQRGTWTYLSTASVPNLRF